MDCGGSYLGLGERYTPCLVRVPTLDRGRGYLPWMDGEGVLTLDGGGGTYLGWWRGVPTLDGEGYLPWTGEEYLPWMEKGVSALHGKGVPTLEGVPTLNRERGTLDGGGVPTLGMGEGLPT